MTPKQKEALDAIRDCIIATGVSPSYEEIAHALGLSSKSGVHRLVYSLVRQGHLIHVSGAARTLALPGTGVTAERVVEALFRSEHVMDDGDGPLVILSREEAMSVFRAILGR